MKAILKSIKSKQCANIMNLIQSILVIKDKRTATAIQKLIDENGYADIYVHCTKGKSLIYTDGTDGKGDYVDYKYYESYKGNKNDIGSDKVLFKFHCYKVEEIKYDRLDNYEFGYFTDKNTFNNICKLSEESCLELWEIDNYLQEQNGFAIHISDLEIFDRPKELSWFRKLNTPSYEQTKPFAEMFGEPYTQEEYKKQCEIFGFVLTKAPQNFCYVEVEECKD